VEATCFVPGVVVVTSPAVGERAGWVVAEVAELSERPQAAGASKRARAAV
jgi:hypothetical protein